MKSITEKIKKLKKEKNAVILVHNYQISEVQDIADFLGDSLGLSIQASKTDAKLIVFCGVYFMAETAKILSPHKKVIIPELEAGCPMADMVTAGQLRALKDRYPKAKTMCYVNTPAEVKAECDLCCTSANAITMVEKAFKKDDKIIFVPDKYLADYVSKKTGHDFISWHGYCSTHVMILKKDILKQKKLHPKAVVLVHPECNPEVVELADQALSTEGMCKYAKKSKAEEMIIGTENGLIYRLKKENPDKEFYPASDLATCPNMKRTNLEKVLWALEETKYEVNVPQDTISRASQSIQKMIDFSK